MRKEGANFLSYSVFLRYFPLILSKKRKFTSKRDLFLSSDIDWVLNLNYLPMITHTPVSIISTTNLRSKQLIAEGLYYNRSFNLYCCFRIVGHNRLNNKYLSMDILTPLFPRAPRIDARWKMKRNHRRKVLPGSFREWMVTLHDFMHRLKTKSHIYWLTLEVVTSSWYWQYKENDNL